MASQSLRDSLVLFQPIGIQLVSGTIGGSLVLYLVVRANDVNSNALHFVLDAIGPCFVKRNPAHVRNDVDPVGGSPMRKMISAFAKSLSLSDDKGAGKRVRARQTFLAFSPDGRTQMSRSVRRSNQTMHSQCVGADDEKISPFVG